MFDALENSLAMMQQHIATAFDTHWCTLYFGMSPFFDPVYVQGYCHNMVRTWQSAKNARLMKSTFGFRVEIWIWKPGWHSECICSLKTSVCISNVSSKQQLTFTALPFLNSRLRAALVAPNPVISKYRTPSQEGPDLISVVSNHICRQQNQHKALAASYLMSYIYVDLGLVNTGLLVRPIICKVCKM